MISLLRSPFALMGILAITFALSASAQAPQVTQQHKGLATEVGVWDAETKMWSSPDRPPVVGRATETNKMLGGQWLISDFKGSVEGMPFEGHGQFGYDPVAKKFIGTWIDTMSPYLQTMEGTMDANEVLTLMSRGRDPMTGEVTLSKLVSSSTDADHKKFEMYAPAPEQEGAWWKMMEINYTRRK